MVPSRAFRYIVPLLFVSLLVLPGLAQSTDTLVATWKLEYMPGGYAVDDRLIYRAGKMVLESRHPGGELLLR